MNFLVYIKVIYSEKTTKFCEIFTLLLSNAVPVKSKVKISQKFVAFSEYINFNINAFTYRVPDILMPPLLVMTSKTLKSL